MSNANFSRFFREFLRNPGTIGAIAPSSRFLARRIVQVAKVSRAKTIVEYGPGTGVFTREILRRAPEGARVIAIERNPEMAAHIRRAFPRVLLHEGSVHDLPQILEREGIDAVESIVSGLPWAAFPPKLQDELLEVTVNALRPGGVFATFAYLQGVMLPAGQRFRRRLMQRFPRMKRSPTVWANIPPAFVYRCEKVVLPVGFFDLDSSARLCWEAHRIESAEYRRCSRLLAKRFRLHPTGNLIVGLDEVFQDYTDGKGRTVGLEWDIWSGYIIVAKNRRAEPLVTAMGQWMETNYLKAGA